MKQYKRFLVLFLSLVTLIGTGLSNTSSIQIQANDDQIAVPVTLENTYEKSEFYHDNLFGVAGGFHLVGFTSVKTQSHAHGNIMTNKLYYNSNFGTRNHKEVSYIKNLASPVGGFASTDGNSDSLLVVGKGIRVGTEDNGRNFALDGGKVDQPARHKYPNNLWQDDTAEYIDMDKERQFVIDVNQRLRNTPDFNTTVNLSDRNNQYVEIDDPTGISYATIDADSIQRESNVFGKGFERGKQGILVLNVDLKGKSSFDFQGSMIKYTDGSTAPTGEVSYWQDGNVVWNFFDSSQPDGLYRGNLQNGRTTTGHVLAPAAKINLTQGLNGTVIADEIIVTAESHKTDITSFTSLSVNKEWIGTPADFVTVKLFADGVYLKEIVLSSDNNWSHVFNNLPKFRVSDKQPIVYTIEEVPIDSYVGNITGDQNNGYTITNKKVETEKISFPVEKKWVGTPASEVTIKLLADGVEVTSIKLNEANAWKHTFSDLLKFDEVDGHEIVYTIEEVQVDGYESLITGSVEGGFIVTNTKTPEVEKISIPVEKKWVGTPASEVTIKLLADGVEVTSIKLNEANAWKHTFSDLLKFDEVDGHEIVYTIEEVQVDGYESLITGSVEGGFIVTNTKTPEVEKLSIPVEKKWVGTPVSEVTIKLLADGVEVTSIKLNEANAWKHTFSDLLKFDEVDGHEIDYTIEELKIDGYETVITGDVDEGFIVTNTETHIDEITNIFVQKAWEGTPLNEVTVRLFADGKEITFVKLNENNEWKHIFENLPKYDDTDDHLIVYTVHEDDIDGYESIISGSAEDGYVITNTELTPEIERFSMPVEKKWIGILAKSVTVKLLADGKEIKQIVLNPDNSWKYTFKDLRKYSEIDQHEIKYTLKEVGLDGYISSIIGNLSGGFTIMNTKITPEIEKISIPVEKKWIGTPANSVTIKLLADGEEVKQVDLSDVNEWKHTFKNLNKTDKVDGHTIAYTIEEVKLDGYESITTGSVEDGFVITNKEITPVIEKISIPIEKKWIGTPTKSVSAKLLADGVEKNQVELNDANAWKHTFVDLLKFDETDGHEIIYTIEEVKLDGYEVTITGSSKDGFVITNKEVKPEIEKISIPIEKKWIGKPTDFVSVKLLADGVEKNQVELNDANAWKHTFVDLLKYDEVDGHEIVYTIEEDKIEGYTSEITGDLSKGFTITNTFVIATKDLTVNKIWIGGPDIKPTIEVQLYRNGQPYGDSVFLENGTLSYTWKDLEITDINGNEYKYTVDEINPPTGYSKSVEGMNITNEYTPGKVALQVEKIWIGGPKDTPEIQVQLLRNGKAYGDLVTLPSGSTKYLWKDLDATDSSGKPYKYSVDEINVPKGYKKTISGNTITNTYSEDPTTVTPKPKQPKTGINNDINVYVLAALLAGGTATVIVRNRKKKHQ